MALALIVDDPGTGATGVALLRSEEDIVLERARPVGGCRRS